MPLQPLTSQQTLDRARTFIQSGKGAGLPELLAIIQTLSTDLEKISMGELTDIMEKDPVVVTRILGTANTLRHNPGITPLTSLTHAVHQVGFHKVRTLAVSMMLMDNAAAAGNSPEQRDAAAQALCSGLISRSCAVSAGYADPDLLFACGTLRNLGKVILPSVSLEHFREALVRREKMPDEIAFRGMFGMTPLDLSRRLAALLRMPEEITYALRDCQPETLGGVASLHNGRVLGICEFGSQLATLALSPKSNADAFIRHSRALARRFERILPDARDMIDPALEHTNEHLGTLTKQGGFIPVAAFLLIRTHVKSAQPAATPDAAPPASPPNNPPTKTTTTPVESPSDHTPEAIHNSESVPQAPIAETTPVPAEPASPPPPVETDDWAAQLARSSAFESKQEPAQPGIAESDSTDPWVEALQTIRELMQADHAAVFLGKPKGKQATLGHSTGVYVENIPEGLVCRSIDRTVFGVCLMRRETVLIHDASDASLDNYLPEWMQIKAARPGAFMLLPFADDHASEGFVYVCWKLARKITITPAQTSLIRSLAARQFKRQSPASPVPA